MIDISVGHLRKLVKNDWLVTAAIVAIYLLIKILLLTPRFGDGFEYIYMAKMLWSGVIPYRDYLLVDPPFFELVLAPLVRILGANWRIIQLLPAVAETATAIILVWIGRKEKLFAPPLAGLLYLTTFSSLATSDYLTGVHLVTFLITLALAQAHRPIRSGITWGMALATKLYAIPIFAGFLVEKLIKKNWRAFLLAAAAAATTFILILLPFVSQAPHNSLNYLILHHLSRTTGIQPFATWLVFFRFEWLQLVFGLSGLFISLRTKRPTYVIPFTFTLIFFILFQDIYYNYLVLLMPFLVIFTLRALTFFRQLPITNSVIIPSFLSLLAFSLLFSLGSYFGYNRLGGRFTNFNEVKTYLQSLPQLPLYGSHEVVPQLALATNLPILDHISETNSQNFASGALDLTRVSQQLLTQQFYLIARTAHYPEQGITHVGFEGYFDRQLFDQHCQELKTFTTPANETLNAIGIYQCQVIEK